MRETRQRAAQLLPRDLPWSSHQHHKKIIIVLFEQYAADDLLRKLVTLAGSLFQRVRSLVMYEDAIWDAEQVELAGCRGWIGHCLNIS